MLEELKKEVYLANMELPERGIVIYTWGNVSGISPDRKYMVIKPSGVEYSLLTPDDMVIVDLDTGKPVEGNLRPSSDTPTHLELYRSFPEIKGITHTHSLNAVAFAQAGVAVPALGTTHADYFHGEIPCTRSLSREEVETDYEKNTGLVITETVKGLGYAVCDVPGILVKNHGPFTWGSSPAQSVYHAVVLETIAEMAMKTRSLNPQAVMPEYVSDKHYNRKHGKNAYYGQK